MFDAIGMGFVKARGFAGLDVGWNVKTRVFVGLDVRWTVKTQGFVDLRGGDTRTRGTAGLGLHEVHEKHLLQ